MMAALYLFTENVQHKIKYELRQILRRSSHFLAQEELLVQEKFLLKLFIWIS